MKISHVTAAAAVLPTLFWAAAAPAAGPLDPGARPVAAPDTIPFRLVKDQILIAVPFGARDTLNMLLDTGATPSAISLAYAREARLLESESPIGSVGGGGGGSATAYRATMSGGRIGSVTLDSERTMAIDFSIVSERFGEPLGGVLGHTFLDGRVVRIDYPRRLLIIEPDGPPDGMILYSDTLVIIDDQVIPLVDVQVNGVTMPVSLDTGSSLVLELFPRGAEAASIEPVAGSEQELAGAGGRFVSATGRARSIALGAAATRNRVVTLSEARGSEARWGNLGNGFLRDFVVTLDYRGRLMSISREEPDRS